MFYKSCVNSACQRTAAIPTRDRLTQLFKEIFRGRGAEITQPGIHSIAEFYKCAQLQLVYKVGPRLR